MGESIGADDRRCLQVRREVVRRLHAGSASHLGSNMSMVEILVAIYSTVDIEGIAVHKRTRDRVVVSKGHAAAATYATLAEFGILDAEVLRTYHTNGTLLAGHVSHAVTGVEHSTGALGHGLNVALGMAIGLSVLDPDARVFCVCGDGEIQEGSNWEALMLWSHLGLKNLVLAIDHNRISSITRTHSVINMDPLAERFAGFGFRAVTVDGHDVSAIQAVFDTASSADRPTVVVCETTKGKGIPFAEDDPIWHYRTLNDELLAVALAALQDEED